MWGGWQAEKGVSKARAWWDLGLHPTQAGGRKETTQSMPRVSEPRAGEHIAKAQGSGPPGVDTPPLQILTERAK